jgi:hypothetical protein
MTPGPAGFPTVHSVGSHTSVLIGQEWDEHVNISARPCSASNPALQEMERVSP